MALQSPHLQKAVGALSKILLEDGVASSKYEAVANHIKSMEADSRYLLSIDFPSNSTWFNTKDKDGLSFYNQLKGKLTILDFFTYCCINCIHILPDLHKLEQKFTDQDGVVVVGVHSAKFPNEKGFHNLLNAILRYNITHPVINDINIELWEKLAVTCWPTLVVVGPSGHLLYYLIGEGHYLELESFVESAVQFYNASLSHEPVGILSEQDKQPESDLRFPGKIATNLMSKDGHLYVSDTANHRVLVIDKVTGLVRQVYGSGLPGSCDGAGRKAEFNSPQGLAYCDGQVYVADTENHLIRKIDLSNHSVTTVAGTGKLGQDKVGGKVGTEQEICSPWDLSVNHDSTILYIAMAGSHQIWAYFIKSTHLLKNFYCQGTVVRLCGSGEEANKNNSFPFKAALAQPSGIDLNTDGSTLYIADSESSTVRSVSTVNGAVKGLVGGALDPMDLFAFGDKDGKGRDVRLQHPLGVAWDSVRQLLYVADSYNHKIKSINPVDKTCTTLVGNGIAGNVNGGLDVVQLSEPGGLCIGGDNEVFMADTNNHCIKVIDLVAAKVNQFKIYFPTDESLDMPDAPTSSDYVPLVSSTKATLVNFDPVTVAKNGEATICLTLQLEEGFKLSHEPASLYQVVPSSSFISLASAKGSITDLDHPINFKLKTSSECEKFIFKVELVIFYCSHVTNDVCLSKKLVLSQQIMLSDSVQSSLSSVVYCVKN